MTERDTYQELDNLKSELSNIREDLSNLMAALKEEAGSQASRVSEKMKAGYEASRDAGQKAYEKARQTVEDKPLVSVLAAFGIGFLMGKLLLRGGRE